MVRDDGYNCNRCGGTGAVKEDDHENKDISDWEKMMGTECPKCAGLGKV
tara:strand:+ start:30 stop:176 length:147 start_codon:yes stop_codon:yes gene_type:complete